VWVDAMAIQVFEEERLAGHAVGECIPEQQRTESVLRRGRKDGQSAGITEEAAQGPVPHYAARQFARSEAGCPVGERKGCDERLRVLRDVLVLLAVENVVDVVQPQVEFLLESERAGHL